MLVYGGHESWSPTFSSSFSSDEDDDGTNWWQNCIDTTKQLLQTYPRFSGGIWNEIIMTLPNDLADIVQAVFYITTSTQDEILPWDNTEHYRKEAKIQAKKMGGKYVLVMNRSDTENLFRCDNTISTAAAAADDDDDCTSLSKI